MFKNDNFVLHVSITKNNTILTLTDFKGQVLLWQSAGSSDFSGSRKKGKVASITACSKLCEKIIKYNIKKINIIFKGQFKKWRRPLIKVIKEYNLEVEALMDCTPIPFNGCRKKKPKR